jgi:hypothetical protein
LSPSYCLTDWRKNITYYFLKWRFKILKEDLKKTENILKNFKVFVNIDILREFKLSSIYEGYLI